MKISRSKRVVSRTNANAAQKEKELNLSSEILERKPLELHSHFETGQCGH
jgi:hypothetical protein